MQGAAVEVEVRGARGHRSRAEIRLAGHGERPAEDLGRSREGVRPGHRQGSRPRLHETTRVGGGEVSGKGDVLAVRVDADRGGAVSDPAGVIHRVARRVLEGTSAEADVSGRADGLGVGEAEGSAVNPRSAAVAVRRILSVVPEPAWRKAPAPVIGAALKSVPWVTALLRLTEKVAPEATVMALPVWIVPAVPPLPN